MKKSFKKLSFICILLIIGSVYILGSENIKVMAQKKEGMVYEKYTNGRFGFLGIYPKFLTEKFESENGDGIILKDKDQKVTLIMSGINNVLDQTVESLLNEQKEDKNIIYEEKGKDFYVFSWSEDDKIKYDYRKVGTGSIQGFLIEYPKDREVEFKEIIKGIKENFKTGNLEKFS
ncbi:MAG: hypothetical protein ACRDDY_04490 [Clostridium sp.]|uniref:hypothetical protein n=1 Tax=Clostridium sp. TaxID=1506 RepID=UPI003EE514DC